MAPKAAIDTIDRLGPEIPADLAGISDADLQALLTEALAADTDDAELTPAYADMLEAMIGDVDRVTAELAGRTTAATERTARVAELRSRLRPAETVEPVEEPVVVPPIVESAGPGTEPAVVAPIAPAPVPDLLPVAASAVVNAEAIVRAIMARSAPTVPARARRPEAQALPWSIIASADVPGVPMGHKLGGIEAVAKAIHEKYKVLRGGSGNLAEDKVIVASILSEWPEARQLRAESPQVNQRRLNAAIRSLTSAGGLSNVLTPYFPFMTIANADRPFRDSLNTMQNIDRSRGGVRIIPPLTFADAGPQARAIADAVTNSTILVTSATAVFTASDVGAIITAADIPPGTYISAILSATNANMSQAATASTGAHAATITRPGAAGSVTVAQDAAALGAAGGSSAAFAGTKPPFRIPVPAPIDVPVWAVFAALRFGNLQAMAWPELIEAWLILMMAQWARRGETMLLDAVIADCRQLTAGAVYGGARQLVAQDLKAAATFRNVHRTKRDYRLNIAMPAWMIDAATAELVLGSGYDSEFYNIGTDEVIGRFDDIGFDVALYVDTPTSVGQLINGGALPANGQPLPPFPTTVESVIYAPESYTFIDDGVLNLGLVRDPQVTGNAPGVVTTMGIRDSALAATNDAILMTESFEGVVRTGIQGLSVTHTVAWNGTAAPLAAAAATI